MAFDALGRRLGTFREQREAARAILDARNGDEGATPFEGMPRSALTRDYDGGPAMPLGAAISKGNA